MLIVIKKEVGKFFVIWGLFLFVVSVILVVVVLWFVGMFVCVYFLLSLDDVDFIIVGGELDDLLVLMCGNVFVVIMSVYYKELCKEKFFCMCEMLKIYFDKLD